jgi:hypothetical protein
MVGWWVLSVASLSSVFFFCWWFGVRLLVVVDFEVAWSDFYLSNN